MSEIKDKIIKITADRLGFDSFIIDANSRFVKDLGADSLDTVELVMDFENEFDLKISDEDGEKFHTVGHVVNYIKKQLKEQGEK